MKTENIVLESESGTFWVYKDKASYDVMKTGITHSTCICSFPKNDDGYSLAKAYFDYQVKREKEKAVTK